MYILLLYVCNIIIIGTIIKYNYNSYSPIAIAYLGFFQKGGIQFLIDIRYTQIMFILLYTCCIAYKIWSLGGYYQILVRGQSSL